MYPSIGAAARALWVSVPAMRKRVHRGYTCEDDVDTRVSCEWNGVQYASIKHAARALGIAASTMRNRVRRGYTCDADLAWAKGRAKQQVRE